MDTTLDPTDLEPLLRFGRDDPEPAARLAALSAATHFALDPDTWSTLAQTTWELIQACPEGSATRRAALELAVRIPLRSLRAHMRDVATDPLEPDRDVVASALVAVADPERIGPLLAELATGNTWAYQALAAMALECYPVNPDELPRPDGGPAEMTIFWWAIARARVGDAAGLEAIFHAGDDVPMLFWGSPWTAYDQIGTIRPIPDSMRDHLLQMLQRAEADEATGAGALDHDHLRALRLTVWAATGIADAEGSPLPPPQPPAPVHLPAEFDVAEGIAELVEQQFQLGQPRFDDGQVAWMIAREPAPRFIAELVALAHPGRSVEDRVRVLGFIGLAADCQSGRAPSPYRGAGGGGSAAAGALELIDDMPHAAARMVEAAAPAAMPDAMFDLGADERLSADFGLATSGSAPDFDFAEDAAPSVGAAAPTEISPPSPAHTASNAPDATPTTVVSELDQRQIQALIYHHNVERHSLVAGAENIVRCWIGLREQRAAAADRAIRTTTIPPEGLDLSVELCWAGQGSAGQINLPANRSARTQDCDLKLTIPPELRVFTAQIMFRYRGRVFECVQIEAPVRRSDEAEHADDCIRLTVLVGLRETIELPDRTRFDSTLICGPASLNAFSGKGGKIYDLSDATGAITWLNSELFATEKSLVRKRAALGLAEAEAELDADDVEVITLLRDMARHGAAIHQALQAQGFKDPGERIQLLNLEPSAYTPLEFVYDRGYPADDVRLCGGWRAALRADGGDCPVCSQAIDPPPDEDWMPTLCPLGFWSLRKIIERLEPDAALDLSTPRPARRALRPIDKVVFASSSRVPNDEREATTQTLRRHFAHPALAANWKEWKQAVSTHPPLLIALPHHDASAALDYLQIGDDNQSAPFGRLSRGQLSIKYVNPDAVDPGPIVLLLGCLTGAKTEIGYVQMARRFQQFHAAIVLGTLAQILGRHAGPLVRELVDELLAVQDADADFGTILRRVRRKMLGRGYLMALCLVALGDSEWHLTPRAN